MKVQRTIVVTLTSAWALALVSHFKVLHQSFYFMGKALSGELSCMRTGLVSCVQVPHKLRQYSGFYISTFLACLYKFTGRAIVITLVPVAAWASAIAKCQSFSGKFFM